MLRMVIFDFDGVIADSERAHYELFRETFATKDIDVSWDDYQEKYLGYTDYECIEHVLEDRGIELTETLRETLFQYKKDRFIKYIENHNLLLPGVEALLKDLNANGVLCGICSGALDQEIRFILEKHQLINYFEYIISAEDVKQGKPNPEGYLLGLEKGNDALNNGLKTLVKEAVRGDGAIHATECVVIEDSLWGIQAGQAAGMRCLAVQTSYDEGLLEVADKTVGNLEAVSTSVLDEMLGD